MKQNKLKMFSVRVGSLLRAARSHTDSMGPSSHLHRLPHAQALVQTGWPRGLRHYVLHATRLGTQLKRGLASRSKGAKPQLQTGILSSSAVNSPAG